jgi:hypothetical protein
LQRFENQFAGYLQQTLAASHYRNGGTGLQGLTTWPAEAAWREGIAKQRRNESDYILTDNV